MRIKRFFLIVLSIIILPFTSAFAGGHYSGPDLSGQKIAISGPWLAPQDDQFRKVIKAFTDATGAVVEYGEGLSRFDLHIQVAGALGAVGARREGLRAGGYSPALKPKR